jgi:hypothetical protein
LDFEVIGFPLWKAENRLLAQDCDGIVPREGGATAPHFEKLSKINTQAIFVGSEAAMVNICSNIGA